MKDNHKADVSHTNEFDKMYQEMVKQAEDKYKVKSKYSDNEPLDIPTMTTDFVKEHRFPCPDGYIFKDENGNVINTQKIVLEKKKRYPKTYEECLSVLQIKGYDIVTYVPSWTAYEKTLCQQVLKLRELIICRDAYWKIAGEEMGLGKPWKPDWNHLSDKWILFYIGNRVGLQVAQTRHSVFAFPTPEMRDAFYENFKEEIEFCKEFL